MATGATVAKRPDSVPGVDILSHDVYAAGVPLDAYDLFRTTAPVAWVNETPANGHSGFGFWAVTRWDDVEGGLKDHGRLISSRGTILELIKANVDLPPGMVIFDDPPSHTAYRGLMSRVFTL